MSVARIGARRSGGSSTGGGASASAVRVTVIAAGFDRWEGDERRSTSPIVDDMPDVFGGSDDDGDDGDDEFDVPSFLQ